MLAQTQSFLRDAAGDAETKRALVDLARHVFTHEETLAVVVDLARWVFGWLRMCVCVTVCVMCVYMCDCVCV